MCEWIVRERMWEDEKKTKLTAVDVVEALESAFLPPAIERHFVRSRSSSSSSGTGTGSFMKVGHPVFEDAGGGGPVARGRVEVEASPGLEGRLTVGQAVLFADACRSSKSSHLGGSDTRSEGKHREREGGALPCWQWR